SRSVLPVCPVLAGRVSRPRPPPVPGTHSMTPLPSTAPQRVPLPSPPASSLRAGPDPASDSLRAASLAVARFLATAVTDPLFESTAASALVTELVDFAAACCLDYATSLVAESVSASVGPPSVGGECALDTDVLEDRQEEFECFAASVPHLVSILLAPEGDPDAPDIPTPCSYAEAIEGPYSSQWQAAMDAEMASWKTSKRWETKNLLKEWNVVRPRPCSASRNSKDSTSTLSSRVSSYNSHSTTSSSTSNSSSSRSTSSSNSSSTYSSNSCSTSSLSSSSTSSTSTSRTSCSSTSSSSNISRTSNSANNSNTSTSRSSTSSTSSSSSSTSCSSTSTSSTSSTARASSIPLTKLLRREGLPPQRDTRRTSRLSTLRLSTLKRRTLRLHTLRLSTPRLSTPKLSTPRLSTPKLHTLRLRTPRLSTPRLSTPSST
ncbi:unnamed protein product, partial [Closterium sp. NIES-54]